MKKHVRLRTMDFTRGLNKAHEVDLTACELALPGTAPPFFTFTVMKAVMRAFEALASAEYEKAATIYKNHKEWAKAIYAYTKCAEANDKASLPTKVATALDLKAGCHRDAGQVGDVK